MAQMFISPIVIRAIRSSDGMESFDRNEDVEWFIVNEATQERMAGPYATYEAAMPRWTELRRQHR